MESWLTLLQSGQSTAAWDEFIGRYRRLIFAGIRHSTTEPDEVMDVFAHVCEALRADELARLRKFPQDGSEHARFSTWLVTVVHHLTLDWFRHRDGRNQRAPPSSLTPRQQNLYQRVFLQNRPHLEAYELLRRNEPTLEYRGFLKDLRVAQRAFNETRRLPRPRTVSLSSLISDPVPEVEETLPAEETLSAEEARRWLDPFLGALSAQERLALTLFVVDEVPAVEVARMVGWRDAKTVYNRIYRLLRALRRELSSRGVGPGDL